MSDAVFEGIAAYTSFREGAGRVSDGVGKLVRMNRWVQRLEFASLIYDSVDIVFDKNLDPLAKMGRISTLVFAAAVTAGL